MGVGYTRQSVPATNDVIEASDGGDEFVLLESAMAAGTGHSHDGTSGEGGTLDLTAPPAIGGSTPAAGTFTKVTSSGDTVAGDNATMGYTSAEGLILTGQGSTDDITIKNDADTTILNVATGGTDIEISAGNIFFGASAKGVYLGVTSATAANLLDDYEFGDHVATVVCSSSGSYGLDTASDTLAYTKVGRVVHVQGELSITSESSPSGGLRISLPFTSAALTEFADISKGSIILQSHGDAGIESPMYLITTGTAYASLQNMVPDGTLETIDEGRVDTAFTIDVNITYIAA